MRSWIVVHVPSRSLIKIIARSLTRVVTICARRGWRPAELLIRVK